MLLIYINFSMLYLLSVVLFCSLKIMNNIFSTFYFLIISTNVGIQCRYLQQCQCHSIHHSDSKRVVQASPKYALETRFETLGSWPGNDHTTFCFWVATLIKILKEALPPFNNEMGFRRCLGLRQHPGKP
jgi:hypothetical protein